MEEGAGAGGGEAMAEASLFSPSVCSLFENRPQQTPFRIFLVFFYIP
jgi:hypothetical protein